MRCLQLFFSLVLAVSSTDINASDKWPQFRGPTGDGHSDAVALPVTFDNAKAVAWKTAIDGLGYSSPVIDGDRIWLTTAITKPASPEFREERLRSLGRTGGAAYVVKAVELRAVCIDRVTGKTLHDVAVFNLEHPSPISKFNSYASPTPIIEDNRLYCDFGEFGTACLDATTGKIHWTRSLRIEHFVGPGSSPTVSGDLLILVRDGGFKQYVIGLNKRTGQTVWKTKRPPIEQKLPAFRKAYGTPLLVETDGHEQLISAGAQWVVAYEPETGEEIWRVSFGNSSNAATQPIFVNGVVYICTGTRTQLWAIRVNGKGDVTNTHVLWKATKQIPGRSSPVLVDDAIYMVSKIGVATCLDATNGNERWQKRLTGNYSASPIHAAGKIFFFCQNGDVTVIRPGREYDEVAKSRIAGRLMATPAITGKSMFIRTDTHLFRIE